LEGLPVILLAYGVHQITSHRVLDFLRKKARRGKEVIVFRHSKTRNYILAETNGRVVREVAVIPGWPNVSASTMQQLVKQLRPMRGVITAKNKLIVDSLRKKKERIRDLGRFRRELMARVRRGMKGVNRDHPSIKWPEIRGEGV